MAEPSSHRARVCGAFLQQYHGKPVCLLGAVIRADGGGNAFQVKAADGAQITVRLKSPITEPLSGLIEVYGIGQGRNLILADHFTTFPEGITQAFGNQTIASLARAYQQNSYGNLQRWTHTGASIPSEQPLASGLSFEISDLKLF